MERNGVKLKIIRGLFFLFLFLLQSITFAEVKETIAEGTYNMLGEDWFGVWEDGQRYYH